jgi:hypothetical protein
MSFEERNNISNKNNKFGQQPDHQTYGTLDSCMPGQPSKIRYFLYIFKRIWSDRRLRLYLIIGVVVLKVLLLFLVIFLAPLFSDMGEIIKQDGLRGLMGNVAELFGKLRSGA